MQRVEVDEGRLMEVRAQGQRIEKLLADPDLNYCIEELRKELYEAGMRGTSVEIREEAVYLNRALDMLTGRMNGIAQRGKIADSTLEKLAKGAADLAKRTFRRSA